jgi:hypothetical protein
MLSLYKVKYEHHYSKGKECIYIQDLKAHTIPNGIWYCTHHAIILHVTEMDNKGFMNIIKELKCHIEDRWKVVMHSQIP